MATTKKTPSKVERKSRPPITQEAEDAEMIALAYDQARNMLKEGTAPAPMVLFFLKKGSDKEKLELEKLREENKLLNAKTGAIENDKRTGEMFEKFMDSIRKYNGDSVQTYEESEEDDEYY